MKRFHLKGSLQKKEVLWLVARVLVFPAAVLSPYFIASSKSSYHCAGEQCSLMFSNEAYFLPFVASVIGIAMLVSFYRQSIHQRLERRLFAKWQLVVSVIAATITLIAYVIMREYSRSSTNFVYDFSDQGGVPPTVSFNPLFEQGLQWTTVLLLTVIYLSVPAVRAYNTLVSRKRIDGVKKEDIFQ